MKHFEDTIAAIATPVGTGGIGVVRLSGDQAIRISGEVLKEFPQTLTPRYVYHGWIVAKEKLIDEVLYYYLKAGESYTGEDTIEISGHGGGLILKEILNLCVGAGARLAEPGEFTKRAFLNGRIDLSQAEAVVDLISAKTEIGVESAAAQLAGKLSSAVSAVRQPLVSLLAEVEAGIDFNDDIDEITPLSILAKIEAALEAIQMLLSTANQGRVLREGVRTAIVGKPNVGKSSLMNALLGEDRSIVTGQPGTTRDTIEETLNLLGLPLVVIDTSGIHHPRGQAEGLGVERARREMASADLSLVVLDASDGIAEEDRAIIEEANQSGKALLVLNKIDLGNQISTNGNLKRFEVSALKGQGMEELKQGIFEHLIGTENDYSLNRCLVNNRHKECLMRANEGLERVLKACQNGAGNELLAVDLRGAIQALGEVNGESVSEEVIDAIFDRFCVGK